jgi:hypothetical protein
MLSYKKVASMPMSLWEKVKAGQDIGLDTSKDVICPDCWGQNIYTKLAWTGSVFVCSTHGKLSSVMPEWVIETTSQYRGYYETKLIERLKMNNQLIKKPESNLLAEKAQLTRMQGVVRSALMGIGTDLGKLTEDIITVVAHGALIHGLNPATGEIFPYIEKDEKGNISKFTLGINYKGLARSARRQAQFNIPHSEIRRLDAEEIRQKQLNITPNWAWFRDKSKPQFVEHPPEKCIAVEVPLYRLDIYEKLLELAERAVKVGAKPIPVTPQSVGLGVWRPGDSIPSGRTAEWRAELRGIKDAITKAYDLSFDFVSMYVDRADEYVERNTGLIIEAEPQDQYPFTVDDVLTEELPFSDPLLPTYPGELLNDKRQKVLTKQLASFVPNPEGIVQQVFGDIGLSDVTDIMAKNIVELAKRQAMLKEGRLTSEDVGYPGLSVDVVSAALEQDCLGMSKLGRKWMDAESLKEVKE